MTAKWTSSKIPAVLHRYDRAMADDIRTAIIEGFCEWRINGSTHLEIRSKKNISIRTSFSTTGTRAPICSARWRSFYRKLEKN